MKFCTECGKKLSDGAKFCDQCGTRVCGGEAKEPKNDVVRLAHLTRLLDDDQVEKVKSALESLKEDSDCDRIHIMGEDDFDSLVSNFIEVIKNRGGDDDMAAGLEGLAIALIDNSKTGHGKRGTLITKLGLFVVDKDIPNYEDGRDDDGGVPWALFMKFGKPVDDETYCLLNVGEFNESDDVDDEVKENLEYSDTEFLLRFSRTDLSADQVSELIVDLKEAVECDVETDDEDDEDAPDEDDEDALDEDDEDAPDEDEEDAPEEDDAEDAPDEDEEEDAPDEDDAEDAPDEDDDD